MFSAKIFDFFRIDLRRFIRIQLREDIIGAYLFALSQPLEPVLTSGNIPRQKLSVYVFLLSLLAMGINIF